MSSESSFSFAIHGGAGVIAKSVDPSQHESALREIIQQVYSFAREERTSALATDGQYNNSKVTELHLYNLECTT